MAQCPISRMAVANMEGTAARTVVVTGASRGIGAAIARQLAGEKYAVAINYCEDEDAAVTLAASITKAGGRARAYKADVASEDDVVDLFDRACRDLGPLAACICNAGITGGLSRVEDVSANVLQDVFAVNVTGAFLAARESVRRLSVRHGGAGGSIVTVSSRAAQLGGSGEWVHYAASKAALDALTIGLAKEVAAEGIRVNAVAPGLIDTGLHAAAGAPDRLTRMQPFIPMGRAGTAEEVAEAVAWLMSPHAAYITGCILPVSGGR